MTQDPFVLSVTLLAMTVFVMTWAGNHFYTRACGAFRHHSADMNTLVAVGTGAAFLFSLLATFAPEIFLSRGMSPELYYEAVIMIISLILTGNALESRAKRQTSAALRKLIDTATTNRTGHTSWPGTGDPDQEPYKLEDRSWFARVNAFP